MNPSLFPIKCRCGKSSTNFRKNIGEFYIDDCCIAAGYDHFGKKAETETNTPIENNPTVADLEVSVQQPEKKKRTYNRSGNVKTDGQS